MSPQNTSGVRPAAVAGLFYPSEPQSLARAVSDLLAGAESKAAAVPKALIAPHAGYVYSGPIAAHAYARLSPARAIVKRVVLLGPTHRVAVRGLAVPAAQAFATPLGTVALDRAAIEAIRAMPQVVMSDDAHALEHSLEVHLPFLQAVLDDFTLVPLAVGHATPQEVAAVIEALWGGPETLIVVSSDLSHYLRYSEAQAIDRETCEAVLALRTDIDHEQACGATPVAGLALAARMKNMKPELLDLRNSGDTAGDKSRVVGYASFAFYEHC
ncbi:MAG: AmmeMemoRadiSam system protein B [Burkholderiales bacterium]